ncbi:IS110 family transposase [Cytobacillus firmus]|nr:IS110 family transposase [Cytobacillus firmus]
MISEIKKEQRMDKVMVSMEPTGHYWFTLAHILKVNGIKFVAVKINKPLKLLTFLVIK